MKTFMLFSPTLLVGVCLGIGVTFPVHEITANDHMKSANTVEQDNVIASERYNAAQSSDPYEKGLKNSTLPKRKEAESVEAKDPYKGGLPRKRRVVVDIDEEKVVITVEEPGKKKGNVKTSSKNGDDKPESASRTGHKALNASKSKGKGGKKVLGEAGKKAKNEKAGKAKGNSPCGIDYNCPEFTVDPMSADEKRKTGQDEVTATTKAGLDAATRGRDGEMEATDKMAPDSSPASTPREGTEFIFSNPEQQE